MEIEPLGEDGVQTYCIGFSSGLEDEGAEKQTGVAGACLRKVITVDAVEVGDTVRAKDKTTGMWFEGVVTETTLEGACVVDFGEDGEPEVHAPEELRKVSSARVKRIQAVWKKAYRGVSSQLRGADAFKASMTRRPSIQISVEQDGRPISA